MFSGRLAGIERACGGLQFLAVNQKTSSGSSRSPDLATSTLPSMKVPEKFLSAIKGFNAARQEMGLCF
jgi:hypothetical protein